jgi:Uma2 family endonuclease
MASVTLIPVSEYLRTTYRPDRDYLEGELKERNMGEQPHALVQGLLYFIFRRNREEWGVRPLPEQRIQVTPERFRIPDITVLRNSDPLDPIVTFSPLVCIEVLSKDDTLGELQERVNDYAAMGVDDIWAFDPLKRIAYSCSVRGFQQPEDGFLRVVGTPIAVELKEVFAELDRA